MIAGDHAHLSTGPLNEPGIIGGGGAAGVSLLEHLTQEPLRGLYAAQRVTIRSRQHTALSVDHLEGVGHRESGNNGRMACANGFDDPGEQVRRGKTPGDVMNQHNAVVGTQCRQPCLDRSRPVHPSRHDIHPGVLSIHAGVVGDCPTMVDMGGGRHDDHVSHLATAKNAPKCVSQ